jgi:Carboxypeptidase regulatory-like domain
MLKQSIMKNLFKYFFLATFIFIASCTEDTVDVERKGSISGTVVDKETGLPIEGVKVSTNPASSSAITDELGEFFIENVLIDDYSVQAEILEYITTFEPVTVLEDETASVVIEMVLSNTENIAPLQPILVSPEDNAMDVAETVEFVWNSSKNDNDDILYTLELRNGTTSEIMLHEEISDTTYTIANLSRGVNYFWQVKASDDFNDPVESSIRSFTTVGNGSDNRFYFVKKIGNNNVIYSGSDTPDLDTEIDENLIQITDESFSCFRPRQDITSGKVAFLRNIGSETHLFVMDRDGTNINQVTQNIPVGGFRQDEVDFTWAVNGARLYYPHFNRIFAINPSGTGNTLVYEAPEGVFISEIDSNEANNLLVIKTNDAAGYNVRISIINPNTGSESAVVLEGLPGGAGGVDFSIDGTKVLYTRDISGFENPEYRQLDSRIFIYNLLDETTSEVDTDKPPGMNDLDAKYAPNEGGVIFMSTSNDGISQKNILFVAFDSFGNRELLFTDAFMPDWK